MVQSARTFRVFVSSTFGDFKLERGELQKRVFKPLSELAARRGCRFQAIDLRWGVSEEAGIDQKTMKICLGEVARCQKVSPRPNFIILLGNRYGWRPLPYEIPADEYNQIIGHVPPGEKPLVEKWYHRDDNAVPAVYVLQPRTGDYEVYKNWEPLEHRLHKTLATAAARAKFKEDMLAKYTASATEQEIVDGALHVPDADNHVFCYFRTIENLPRDKRGEGRCSSSQFIDLTPEGKFDSSSAEMLETLKGKLEKTLPHHVRRFKSRWDGRAPTMDHLDGLCKQVYKDLEEIILHEIQMQAGGPDALEAEMEAQEEFSSDRVRDFTGREDALQAVADYLASEDDHPFVVFGESGCGKSALMAKAAESAEKKSRDDLVMQIVMGLRGGNQGKKSTYPVGTPEIFSRYIGATPESTTGRGLLESLCRQITRAYDEEESSIPGSFRELSKDLLKRLAYASEERPIFIFLDALDQLATSDNAQTLAWLPTKLPKNVKVVVSILPDEVQRSLKTRLPGENFFEMEAMSLQEGKTVLEAWLARDHRTLKSDQRKCVLDRFKAKGLPLYLKLAFEEARRWKSYDPLPELKPDVPGMIRQMFARLSLKSNHGALLVSKCLGYLAAARIGLSEAELLEVLALDDEFFSDIQATSHKHGHELSERAVPVILWSRLYFDLEPYLSLRAADGSQLLGFFHRQVGEAASEVYLTPKVKAGTHAALARYFASKTLLVEQKPNLRKLSELPFQQTRGELWSELNHTLCDLTFIETKCKAGRTYDLVTDYDRLGAGRTAAGSPVITALASQGVRRIRCPYCLGTSDLERHQPGKVIRCSHCGRELRVNPFLIDAGLEKSQGRRMQTSRSENRSPHLTGKTLQFADFIYEQAHILNAFPELCIQQAANQPDRSSPAKAARKALRDAGEDRTWLRWMNKPQQRSACLMTLDEHRGYVTACAFSPDGNLLISTGDDKTLRVWVTATGEQRSVLRGHTDVTRCCAFSPNGDLAVSGSADKTLKIWDVSSGVERVTLSGHGSWLSSCAFSPDGKQVFSFGESGGIIVWDTANGKEIANYNEVGDLVDLAFSKDERTTLAANKILPAGTGSVIQVITSVGGNRAMSPDGKLVALGNMDGTIKIWDVKTNQEYANLAGHKSHGRASGIQGNAEQVLCCAFSPDGKFLASSSFDKTVKIWDVETRKELATLKGHTEWVKHCCFSPDGRLVASASGDGTIKIWNLADAIQNSQSDDPPSQGHADQALACDFSPDGETIVTASLDYTLKLWETATGKVLKTLEGHSEGVTTCAFSPDGRHVLSGSNDHTVRMWDVEKGKESGRFAGNEFPVRCCTFHSNGRFLAVAGSGVSQGLMPAGRIILLDSGTMKKIIEFEVPPFLFVCAIHPEGTMIASAGGGGTVCLWDLEEVYNSRQGHSELTPVLLEGHDIDFELGDFGSGEPTGIYCLAFSPDGNRLLSGGSDNTLILWDVRGDTPTTGRGVRAFLDHKGWVRTCAFSPDGGQFVSAGGDNTLRLWDLASGETIGMFFAPGIVSCARISPVDETLCCTDVGGGLQILRLERGAPAGYADDLDIDESEELETGQTPDLETATIMVEPAVQKRPAEKEVPVHQAGMLTGHTDAVNALAISPDGRFAVSGSADYTVRIWDLANETLLHTLSETDDCVCAVAVTGSGKHAVSIASNDTIARITVWDLAQGTLVRKLEGHHPVHAAAFTADGRKVLVVHDDIVRLWDIEENRDLHVLRLSHFFTIAAISPDGRWAALGSQEGDFQLLDLEQRATTLWVQCSVPLKAVALTSDGKRALFADTDCTVQVWDVEEQSQTDILEGEDDDSPVTALALTPDLQSLASVSENGTINLWELETGDLVFSTDQDCSLSACAITDDGSVILAGSTDGILYRIDTGKGVNMPQADKSAQSFIITDSALARPLHPEHKNAIVRLVTCLRQGSESERKAAVIELSSFEDDYAVEQISAILKDGSDEACLSALNALIKIRTPRAIELIVASVQYGKISRGLWGTVMGMLGEECVLESLIAALDDQDETVRDYAIAALSYFMMRYDSVEAFVKKGLKDKDDHARRAASKALHDRGYR